MKGLDIRLTPGGKRRGRGPRQREPCMGANTRGRMEVGGLRSSKEAGEARESE